MQVAAPDFWAQKRDKGQLELLKLVKKWGTKCPPSHSKSDITDNIKKKIE